MSHTESLWSFTPAVDVSRQTRLHAWISFDQVIERFSSCSVAPLYWERASTTQLEGCHRASFEICVDPDLYDGFFNSPIGYRGQYARSEGAGELANRRLLNALIPRLISAAGSDQADATGSVTRSLRGTQAKVWIVESEVEDQLSALHPSIVYPPWDFHDPNGQGLRAPRGSRLEIKGAWLGLDGHEVVNRAKNRRGTFIYKTGDTK